LSYSQYLKEIPQYERIEKLHDMERSSLFKIMNAYQAGSYLKFRRHLESYNKDELNAIKRLQELNLIKIQDKQKSFLGRKIFYVLTSSGLFYVFSNILNYPPQLLTRYHRFLRLDFKTNSSDTSQMQYHDYSCYSFAIHLDLLLVLFALFL
jgi:hypothetical protein